MVRKELRREKTQVRQAISRQAVQEVNSSLKKAAKVTPGSKRLAPKSTKGVVKRVESILNPVSDLGKWSRILSRPFEFEGFFCPVSYNPAPSFIQSTARTTVTNLNLGVGPNSTTQIAFWPGHNIMAGDASQTGGFEAPMDAVAYHSRDIFIGGATPANIYVVGPMTKTDAISTKTAAIGVLWGGLGLASTYGTTNSGASLPLTWDVSLPYVADGTKGGHHTRWQMVAMGLRIRNISPEIYRGGNVVTVQPNNNYLIPNAGNQATLEIFPTFYDHGVCEYAEVSWIPRAQDLAFWHGQENISSGGTPSTDFSGPAMIVFFNNPTANTMSYSYELVCHWQLAGTYLNPVGGPAPHAPEVKPHVEKAISFLQNSSHTASQAASVISKAVSHSGSSSSVTWQDYAKLGFDAAKAGMKAISG